MIARALAASLAIALLIAGPVQAGQDDNNDASDQPSPFIGSYDGGRMEMAMGMEIREDGTFFWGLSVGALDMRAVGTWIEEDGQITLTSTPKPVAPQFAWSGIETFAGNPWIRLIWSVNGEPFQYGSATITCRNGETLYENVPRDGLPLPEGQEDEFRPDHKPPFREACDEPVTVELREDIHRVQSSVYDLRELGWEPGKTARFEFQPNDLGVADFTGVTGRLENGRILLDVRSLGRRDMKGPLELRKLD